MCIVKVSSRWKVIYFVPWRSHRQTPIYERRSGAENIESDSSIGLVVWDCLGKLTWSDKAFARNLILLERQNCANVKIKALTFGIGAKFSEEIDCINKTKTVKPRVLRVDRASSKGFVFGIN